MVFSAGSSLPCDGSCGFNSLLGPYLFLFSFVFNRPWLLFDFIGFELHCPRRRIYPSHTHCHACLLNSEPTLHDLMERSFNLLSSCVLDFPLYILPLFFISFLINGIRTMFTRLITASKNPNNSVRDVLLWPKNIFLVEYDYGQCHGSIQRL